MVRLTRAVVLKGISRVSVDKKDALMIDEQFGKVTSLHLQAKNITILDSLKLFTSLTNLYLYENKIRVIEGLDQATNLENLYLQQNKIERIENLEKCYNLRKLYLGYNEIQVVEGLEEAKNLIELHLEYQRLPRGTSLVFSPTTLQTLAPTLLLLNISGNEITTIEDVASMDRLDTLYAMNNKVNNLDDTILITSTLRYLRILDLKGNPITKNRKYKEKIIGYSENVEVLDGKDISDVTRDFIKRFCNAKATRLEHAVKKYGQLAAEQIAAQGDVSDTFSTGAPSSRTYMVDRRQNPQEIADTSKTNPYGNDFAFSTPTSSTPRTVGTVYPTYEEWIKLFQSGNIPAESLARIMMPRNIQVPDFVLKQSVTAYDEPHDGEFLNSFSTNEETEDTDENIKTFVDSEVNAFNDSVIQEPQVIQMAPQTPEPDLADDKMSDMAKVIFRLSNMSSPIANKAKLPHDQSSNSPIWMKPGESLPETRPLTPLELPAPLAIASAGSIHNRPRSSLKKEGKIRTIPRKVELSEQKTQINAEKVLDNNPPFVTSVVELPPWPHITRRMGAGGKKITFMP